MALNKELINKVLTVTSKAAISCHKFLGKNDKINADKAATDTMRNEINKLEINGEVLYLKKYLHYICHLLSSMLQKHHRQKLISFLPSFFLVLQ